MRGIFGSIRPSLLLGGTSIPWIVNWKLAGIAYSRHCIVDLMNCGVLAKALSPLAQA
ncbi:MAG: hypothetical protein ABSG91_13460 [Syntrophobacteraceae bacterium]|jgi:hypothetical protein